MNASRRRSPNPHLLGPNWRAPEPERQVAAGAKELFRRHFDGKPDGVWLAPGRVNLIGDHIDYVGARVLPFALPYLTAVAVRARTDMVVHCVSTAADHGWTGLVPDIGARQPGGWAGYAVGPLWAMVRNDTLAVAPGLDLAVHTTVPLGSGLSSSAALECAVALAVAEMLGVATDDAGRAALARDCVMAENFVVGAPTGGMDQSAVLRARAGHALLLDCADFSAEHLPLDFAAAGLELMIIDTRAPRRLADGQYAQRRASVEQLSKALGSALRDSDLEPALAQCGALSTDTAVIPRMRHVLSEIRRVDSVAQLLRAQSLSALGPVLTASHASLRDDYEVSSVELDTAVEAAVAAGALGARMTGGGFGGCAIALTHAGSSGRVANAVSTAARARKLPAPQFLLATPSAAAHRHRD